MKIDMKYKFLKIWISMKKSRKLQDSLIFRLEILKFPMLTHVYGVARGLSSHGAKHSL